MKTGGPSESSVQRLIGEYLAAERVWYMRLNTGSFVFEHKGKRRFFRAGRKGCADLLALVSIHGSSPAALFIEVKRPGGRQSEEQRDFQNEVEAIGAGYLVASGLDDVMRALSLLREG